MKVSVMNIIGLLVIVVAVALHIVYIASPYIAKAEFEIPKEAAAISGVTGSIEVNYGMWEFCSKSPFLSQCTKFSDMENFSSFEPAWLKAVKAMAIIGMLVAGSAGVAAAVTVIDSIKGPLTRFSPKALALLVCALCMSAAVFIVIGDIVVASKMKSLFVPLALSQGGPPDEVAAMKKSIEDSCFLDWGFILDIVAVVLLISSSGIIYVVSGRSVNENWNLLV